MYVVVGTLALIVATQHTKRLWITAAMVCTIGCAVIASARIVTYVALSGYNNHFAAAATDYVLNEYHSGIAHEDFELNLTLVPIFIGTYLPVLGLAILLMLVRRTRVSSAPRATNIQGHEATATNSESW
jgi:hypothetical protein